MSVRRARRFVGILVVATAAASTAVSAAAAPPPSELQGECPTVMPLADVATGLRGTALSVTSGRNPVTLDVEALGVLRDAVGPGRDVIVVNLSGSAVDAAGGLWYGASGSPVFFRDAATGRYELAGAIAYGLAGGASTLAGLTPAGEMTKLLALGDAAPPAAASIAVPRRLAARMSAASGLSLAQVASLTRLRTPLSASGLTDRGLRRMQQAIDRQGLPYLAYVGSSATENPPAPTGKLRAGDSFAAVLSIGDVTVGGVGTTTLVCDGRVLAFGHPMSWTGETTLGARAADTITIVEDPFWGSYKLANIAESVGVVTQDRLAGIMGRIGVAPPTSPITSTVTDLATGRTRTGTSEAIMPEFLPFLSFEHLFTNVDVTIDRIGPGSAELEYVIRGTRGGGAPWELVRSSRYASPWDISFESVWEPAYTAEILQGFQGEEIVVTSMEVPRLDVEQAFEQYRLRRVLVWNGTKYAARKVVRGKAGKVVRLRAVLDAEHRAGTRTVDLALRVPAGARRNGYVTVTGGASSGPEIPCFFGEFEGLEDECGGPSGGLTFDELLAAFEEQPRGDVVSARLWLGRSDTSRATASRQLDAVVAGHRVLSFRLRR
ncbi:MAG TPA: hypothetical protein VFR63_08560 [Gaiellaceae bacterium]|nr:hypothetical protein [Gaiellaceae bacterium]